jgi:glycosyltransferase involved in cell wall biosynthesis
MTTLDRRRSRSEYDPAQSERRVIAAVIPCYRVARQLPRVVSTIGPEVTAIFCVDDACPEESAATLRQFDDERIRIIQRTVNGGVGAATCEGYQAAIEAGADIIVKLDGDGQMDPRLISALVGPIVRGEADYVKGNRFFNIETIGRMSWRRTLGNAGLSFMTKLSTGYWDIFDPTNGFTAIEARVARELPLDKLHRRFFFESDMLFRLGVLRARVVDLPMTSVYGSEHSNLSELNALLAFPLLHLRNFLKRVVYSYFLHGFSLASVNLLLGGLLCLIGVLFGGAKWIESHQTGVPATAGTVMLAALPLVLGAQLVLSFFSHDMSRTPTVPLHPRLLPTGEMDRARQAESPG